MNLVTLECKSTQDWNTFVNFWSDKYYYPLDNLYRSAIKKEYFDEEDLDNLFIWKNGSILSTKKAKSVDQKIKPYIDELNRYKLDENYNLTVHLEKFQPLSAVWKIFLLHIIKPTKYPIYDQHIHRAHAYITGQPDYMLVNEKLKEQRKIDFYQDEYLPFILNLTKDLPLKKVDEALFAFGQFLKTKQYWKFC